MHRDIESLIKGIPDDSNIYLTLHEIVSEQFSGTRFRSGQSGAAVLEWYCGELERLLQKHSLTKQVENDEAVKAAKRAYDEARSKAYAEARKRL